MKFNVHVFPIARIKVLNIEAHSMAEAIKRVVDEANFSSFWPNHIDLGNGLQAEYVEWSDDVANYAVVDPLQPSGEVDLAGSKWLDLDGTELNDGMTREEQAAFRATNAKLFFDELLASVETLSDIAATFGVATLADLLYLHDAIVHDGYIDYHADGESCVLDVIRPLPHGEQWVKYVRPC